MPGCAVDGCTTGYNPSHKRGTEKKCQLFNFPKSARIKNLWVDKINRQNWQPSYYSRVCLKHFLPTDFKYVPGDLDTSGHERTKYRLKEDALPTLHMKPSENTHKVIQILKSINNKTEKTVFSPSLRRNCNCTVTALQLLCNCAATTLQLLCNCPATALELHCNCTATALTLHCN